MSITANRNRSKESKRKSKQVAFDINGQAGEELPIELSAAAEAWPGEGPQKAIAEGMLSVLCDLYAVMIKTQQVHWNVTGSQFASIHSMTEEQYQRLFGTIDTFAERIRALHFYVPATLPFIAERSSLPPEQLLEASAEEMARALMKANEEVASRLRVLLPEAEGLGDEVTHDMLIEQLAYHEEVIWMWRSMAGEPSQVLR